MIAFIATKYKPKSPRNLMYTQENCKQIEKRVPLLAALS